MKNLTPQLSSYLDFLRFIAALAVLLGHMEIDGLYMAWLPLSEFSHEAVLLFFVLSGFIIYSTSQGRGAEHYAIARVSRIYSVAIPAVLFCEILAILLPQVADTSGLRNYRAFEWSDLFSSLMFLNESWGNTAQLSLNHPYWSLCYEVWYYAIFAAFLFIRGGWRWLAISVVAFAAGAGIMMLFPMWALGAYLAAKGGSRIPGRITAHTLFVGSMLVVAVISYSGIDVAIRLFLYDAIPGFWRLGSSQRFVTDFVIGVCFAANLYAFPHIDKRVRDLFSEFGFIFKFLAGFSFTLYLFHRPFTQLGGLWFPNLDRSIVHSITAAAIILLICLAISYGTERQLNLWRHSLSRLAAAYPRRSLS